MINGDTGQVRHALGKLGERLETTVLEINEQGKEIDRLRVAVAGIFLLFTLVLKDVLVNDWFSIGPKTDQSVFSAGKAAPLKLKPKT